MTAKITLPCGTVALLDIEDLPLIAGYRWYRFKLKGKNITYVRGRRPGQTSGGVFLHCLVFGDTGIDHANGDGLDNRRSNLRRATPQANAFNQGKHRGQVQYKGVTLDQRGALPSPPDDGRSHAARFLARHAGGRCAGLRRRRAPALRRLCQAEFPQAHAGGRMSRIAGREMADELDKLVYSKDMWLQAHGPSTGDYREPPARARGRDQATRAQGAAAGGSGLPGACRQAKAGAAVMKPSELVRQMTAAGAPPEAIAIALEAVEAANDAVAYATEKDSERRRRQAERKARSRAAERDGHGTVTGQSQDKSVTVTPNSPLKESSPTPPKENNPPPSSEPTGSSDKPRGKRPVDHAKEFRAELADADPDLVEAYIQLRKAKRGAMTAAAAKGLLRRAQECGLSPNQALQMCIDRNWITIDAKWLARAPPNLPRGAASGGGKRTIVDAFLDMEIRNGTLSQDGHPAAAQRVPDVREPGPDRRNVDDHAGRFARTIDH